MPSPYLIMPFIARFDKIQRPPFYGGPGPVASKAPLDKEALSPPYDLNVTN